MTADAAKRRDLIWFVRAEDMPLARSAVRIGREASVVPDEAALACVGAARKIIAAAYPLDVKAQDKAASLLEFSTGMDAREARREVRLDTLSPEGLSHLLRILAHGSLLAIDYAEGTYVFAETAQDAAALADGAAEAAAEEAFDRIRASGVSAWGAANVLATVALRRALAGGAAPWKLVRLLIQHLVGVLNLLSVARRGRTQASKLAHAGRG